MGENGVCALIHPILSTFPILRYSLRRKLTKSLALHGFGEIFADVPRFCSAIFRKSEISLFFFLICKTPKRGPICKKLVIIECWNFE